MPDKSNASRSPPPRRDEAPAHRLGAWAKKEARKFFGLFLYLWVLFSVFVLNQSVVLREHGIGFTAQGFALLNALVLAKVMLLFEEFDPGRFLRRRPLIFPILFEALLLTVSFLVVHIAEKVIEGALRGQSVAASLPRIGGGGLVGLASVSVILFVAMIPFFAFRNLSLALGADRLKSLLFSAPGDNAPP